MNRTRWVLALGVVLVVGVVGVVVLRDGDDGGGGGIPVLAGASRADGELGDGVRVPAGTELLADVLPEPFVYVQPFPGGEGEGWAATLLLLGDPTAVLDDLAAQAEGLGLVLHDESPYEAGCEASGYQPPEGLVVCQRAWLGDDDVWLRAEAWRGVVPAGSGAVTDRPVSLLFVELARPVPGGPTNPGPGPVVPPSTIAGLTARPPSRAGAGARTQSDEAPPRRPDPGPGGWPDLPGPGDHVGDGIAPPDDGLVLSLRIPEGARSVVAPWPTGGNARNYSALLAVDDDADADAVMADLSAQVHEWFGPDTREETEELAGARRHAVRGDQAGGSKLDLVAVTIGDRTWITVATGYD